MIYRLHITKTAERDLTSAADYIEFTLKNPSAADDLLDLTEKKIIDIVNYPEARPVVDDPILSAWGIRYVIIDNYLAFYVIYDNTIYIIRFLYGKRDWISILRQGFSIN